MLLIGSALQMPLCLLIAGPSLALSGVLSWVGVRVTMGGPFGAALRAALGAGRTRLLHLRAALWIVVGVVITIVAVRSMLLAPGIAPPWLPKPIAADSA